MLIAFVVDRRALHSLVNGVLLDPSHLPQRLAEDKRDTNNQRDSHYDSHNYDGHKPLGQSLGLAGRTMWYNKDKQHVGLKARCQGYAVRKEARIERERERETTTSTSCIALL